MKNKTTSLGILIFSVLLLAAFFGCKDEIVSPATGSVNGNFTLVDAEGKSVGVSGIKVYLIDTGFKPDTVDISKNKRAIIDSTVSDDKGVYKFANLKEGNYGVVPLPGISNYTFDSDKSSDSYSFSINDKKNSYTVNFQVSEPSIMEDKDPFYIKIVGKNFPANMGNWRFYVSIVRLNYFYCIPINIGTNHDNAFGAAEKFIEGVVFPFQYGYTLLLYTWSNKFVFKFAEVLQTGETKYIFRNEFSFDYDLTLSSCPSSSTFEYDWTAHTFKRIN